MADSRLHPPILICLQYLAPPHIIVRRGLIEGRVYRQLAPHLAAFLAETLFHTSLLALPSDVLRCARPPAGWLAGAGVGLEAVGCLVRGSVSGGGSGSYGR